MLYTYVSMFLRYILGQTVQKGLLGTKDVQYVFQHISHTQNRWEAILSLKDLFTVIMRLSIYE